MLPTVILAGGLATRLQPISEKIPKSLLKVAGEPFIAHQLRELSKQGIENVILCIGHLGEKIQNFLKDGSEYGVKLQYSYETNDLLGTGGAINKALHLLDDEFFVLYGDSWLQINYCSVYESFCNSDCSALMTVFCNQGRWDKSNVEMDGMKIKLYSKNRQNDRMTHIDYGLGILKPELFENFPEESKFDLSEIYEPLSKKGKLASFEAKNRFYEIGSQNGLKELNLFFNQKKGKYELY